MTADAPSSPRAGPVAIGRPLPWSSLSPEAPQFAVEFVDALLDHAVSYGAGDIHLHPRADHYEILFRLDGVLALVDTVPRRGATDPVARLMVMARMPTYRAGEPMEGRLDRRAGEGRSEIEMRLGTFPTVHGLRAVVRLFAARDHLHRLDQLSLDDDLASDLRELSQAHDGAVLLCGPAGSGKTTTLYASLREIASARPRRSVLTIEDPVESVIEGISQSQLHTAGGMTLAAALRSAVRQDPEVLLVSEIRDVETADAVLVSALSGHLVYSSLHSADCAGALRRLVQMRLPPYLIQSGLRAVIAQRLLRRRCPECGAGAESAERAGETPTGETRGCTACGGTGYRGRVLIAECLRFDIADRADAVMRCLVEDKPSSDIRQAAVDSGMLSLAHRAWRLVDEGVTDAAEVYRVLGRSAAEQTGRPTSSTCSV